MTYAAWLGKRGEMIAEELLTRIGAEVLCRNYRCPTGEIDLVVEHERTWSRSRSRRAVR